MTLNLDAVGRRIGPFAKDYTWKDAVLYALGVGAGGSELEYCYEKDLKVLPSFGIVTLYDFMPQLAAVTNVNLGGVLHGEQELVFHRPIPPEGRLVTEGAVTHFYDKGREKGALIRAQFETRDADGRKLFTSIVTVFARLDGGFGGPDAPGGAAAIPERAPDVAVPAAPAADQPLLYRLSGDVFALHVDAEFARMAGFEQPIMHGLCTHGFACRALIGHLVPGAPEKVRRMACRFKRPLYPGTPIQTLIWRAEEGRAFWRVVNAATGEVVIDNGVFEYGELPAPQIRFDRRVAVVTGAGVGLGRVYALELARRGAKVVVNDLGGARDGTGAGSSSPADRVVAEIRAAGGEAVANYDNVATAEGGAAIVAAALSAFGTLDILINNAGILRDKSFLKMAPEHWRAVLDVHLNGAYHVTRPAFAVMREKGYGRILLTTSAAGLYGNFGQTNYTAAKMGLVGLMNTLKLEGEKYGIKVNTIAPVAASRLTEDILPAEALERLKPELVAPLALYLCAEQCPVSGRIYTAGMGCMNRAAVVTGAGVVIGDGESTPTPEQVLERWEELVALRGAKEYRTAADQIGDALALLSRPETVEKGAGQRFAAVAAVFEAMPAAFAAGAAAGVDAVFQYRVAGEGGGEWHCTVRDGACRVVAGVHEKPTCTLKMAAPDFLSMMNGELAPMQAYTTGKLAIEGDVMKSQLIGKLFRLG